MILLIGSRTKLLNATFSIHKLKSRTFVAALLLLVTFSLLFRARANYLSPHNYSYSTDLTASAQIPELSWTLGCSFPVVNGSVIFPTLAPSALPASYQTHWYAGSVYPWWLSSQSATAIYMSIKVPYSAPKSDEFYYVLLSAWDSAGSYDQIGFSDCYGIWGLTYSWTSGPPTNPTYHFSPNAIALSLGVTYVFNITTEGGVTHFVAYQGSNQVWSLDASTGGTYLVLSNSYSGYFDYTDYEEVWQTSVSGGSPAFDFYFFDNQWISTGGTSNAATWTTWYASAPSNVAVVISGNAVLVDNPSGTVLFETDPTSFAGSAGTITFAGSTYLNGQSNSFADGDYSATANVPTDYRFDHWEYSGSSGSGVYASDMSNNPTTVHVAGDGWLKAVLAPALAPTFHSTMAPNYVMNGTSYIYTITITNDWCPIGINKINVTFPAGTWIFNVLIQFSPFTWTLTYDQINTFMLAGPNRMEGQSVSMMVNMTVPIGAGGTFYWIIGAWNSTNQFLGNYSMQAVVDNTKPIVSIIAPSGGYYSVGSGNYVWINASVSDTPSIEMYGITVTCNDSRFQSYPAQPRTQTSPTLYVYYFVNNTAIPDGDLAVKVTAVDPAGNLGSDYARATLTKVRANVHLLLTVKPDQATYKRNQSLTLDVSMLNQLNPSLYSTLTLTTTGPNGYYYFDFQTVQVNADAVGEDSFDWNIPNVAGTYVVEVSLVPIQLTAYDSVWLKIV
jgi:hypothetical protein